MIALGIRASRPAVASLLTCHEVKQGHEPGEPAPRRLIAQGMPLSDAAIQAGFADQSHLNRWFGRYFGITPGGYQRAVL